MARLRGHFEEGLQDSQEFGSTDAHMVSRVYFVLEREKEPISCYVDVGQPYGARGRTRRSRVSEDAGRSGAQRAVGP